MNTRGPLTLDLCRYRYRWARADALAATSIQFQPGRTVLLGPNGAGKSTLLSLMASALRPRSGSITLGDVPSSRRDYRRRVAWLPQGVEVVPGNTLREQVALHGWLKGMTKSDAWCQSLAALQRVGLDDLASRKASQISGGQRARLGVAQALVHNADVMLLDEPTSALDPFQKRAFADLLAEVSEDTIVVVSTHDVHDLAATYERVVLIDQGRVAFDGSMEAFLRPADAALDVTDAYALRLGGAG